MGKIRVREAILVEGRYDAHLLRSLVDGVVLEAGGFSLFSAPEKLALVKQYASARGLVILTDSDSAGLWIRNRLKGLLPAEQVKHAYVPPLPGKEKRKQKPSAQGLLGVEGMTREVVLAALRQAGATVEGEEAPPLAENRWQRADLYEAGLFGRPDSREKRERLLAFLSLPPGLSTNGLLDALNRLFSVETVQAAIAKLDE